jgi:hypothetical protein
MTKCLYVWTKTNFIELLCFLNSITDTCISIFLMFFNVSCMVSKAFSQFSSISKRIIKEYQFFGIYRNYSKDSCIGFFVIQLIHIVSSPKYFCKFIISMYPSCFCFVFSFWQSWKWKRTIVMVGLPKAGH